MTYETELFTALAPLTALTDERAGLLRQHLPAEGRAEPLAGDPLDRRLRRSRGHHLRQRQRRRDRLPDPDRRHRRHCGARTALRLAIQAAMGALATPSLCDNFEDSYDTEAKGYRTRLDFLLLPSSAP
jgi:hypothetical protein